MMRYILAVISVLLFQACSGPTVHYDYASTTLNGADFTFKHYSHSSAVNTYHKESHTKKVITASKPLAKEYSSLHTFNFLRNTNIKANDFALIIGISKYESNPNVPYANNSAQAFAELTHKTFGIPKQNIIMLLDSKATSGSIKSKLHLIKELADKDSTIYFYFAGHGLPSKDGDTFLLPSDMSADAIAYETNLKLTNIYKLLSDSSASKVVVVMDSCFSGKDDSGKLLYQGVAPVMMVKKAKASDKMTIFTAGGAKDFANALDEKQHRMFSYYFIDAVSRGLLNVNDIHKYIRTKVKRASLLKGIGYKQIPQIGGDTKSVLY